MDRPSEAWIVPPAGPGRRLPVTRPRRVQLAGGERLLLVACCRATSGRRARRPACSPAPAAVTTPALDGGTGTPAGPGWRSRAGARLAATGARRIEFARDLNRGDQVTAEDRRRWQPHGAADSRSDLATRRQGACRRPRGPTRPRPGSPRPTARREVEGVARRGCWAARQHRAMCA